MSIDQELPEPRSLPPERFDAAKRQLEVVIPARRRKWAWGWKPSLVATVILSLGVGGGMAIAASLTKGAVPIGPNGALKLNRAPDFVSVSSNGKVVGYVPRSFVIGAPNGRSDEKLSSVVPVYGPNLTRVIGHLYPGIGYARNGVDPSSLSCHRAYILNGSTRQSVPCPSTKLRGPKRGRLLCTDLGSTTVWSRLSSHDALRTLVVDSQGLRHCRFAERRSQGHGTDGRNNDDL